MGARLGFAEDDAAEEGDHGGDGDKEEAVEEAVGEDLRRLEDGVRVFDGEEQGAEDDVEREHAEEKRSEFGEFQERAGKDFGGREPFGSGHGGVVDPRGLQAAPYTASHGAHGASRDADEQEGEGWVGLGLLLDAGDDGFAVVAEEFLDEAGGEAFSCRKRLVEGPDGEDEVPGFDWVFADEAVGLPEGPEEGVVFGSVLRRGLESDPGFCELVALFAGHGATLSR